MHQYIIYILNVLPLYFTYITIDYTEAYMERRQEFNSGDNGADVDLLEKQAVSLYRHVKELAQMKCESELRREDSLIQPYLR